MLFTTSKITASLAWLADRARPTCCLYMMGETVGRNRTTPDTSSTWMPSLSISMQNSSFKCRLVSALKPAKALPAAGSSEYVR